MITVYQKKYKLVCQYTGHTCHSEHSCGRNNICIVWTGQNEKAASKREIISVRALHLPGHPFFNWAGIYVLYDRNGNLTRTV